MQGGATSPPHTHTDLRIRVRIIGFVPTHFQMRTRYFNCPNVVSLSMTGYLVKGLKTFRFICTTGIHDGKELYGLHVPNKLCTKLRTPKNNF